MVSPQGCVRIDFWERRAGGRVLGPARPTGTVATGASACVTASVGSAVWLQVTICMHVCLESSPQTLLWTLVIETVCVSKRSCANTHPFVCVFKKIKSGLIARDTSFALGLCVVRAAIGNACRVVVTASLVSPLFNNPAHCEIVSPPPGPSPLPSGRTCPWPLPPSEDSEARLLSPTHSFSALLEVRCKPGFALPSGLDATIRRCQGDRRWSGEEPICTGGFEFSAERFSICVGLHYNNDFMKMLLWYLLLTQIECCFFNRRSDCTARVQSVVHDGGQGLNIASIVIYCLCNVLRQKERESERERYSGMKTRLSLCRLRHCTTGTYSPHHHSNRSFSCSHRLSGRFYR